MKHAVKYLILFISVFKNSSSGYAFFSKHHEVALSALPTQSPKSHLFFLKSLFHETEFINNNDDTILY